MAEKGMSKDEILMCLLSAQEYISKLEETDQQIRKYCKGREFPDVKRKKIQESLNSRVHFLDNLWEIVWSNERVLEKSCGSEYDKTRETLIDIKRKERQILASLCQNENDEEHLSLGILTTDINWSELPTKEKKQEFIIMENFTEFLVNQIKQTEDDITKMLEEHYMQMLALRIKQRLLEGSQPSSPSNIPPQTSSQPEDDPDQTWVKTRPDSDDEDTVHTNQGGQGWSYRKDKIYMMVLSAEEFLGRMDETDQRIRTFSQASEVELHRKTIQDMFGLRGHMQDELLRIEQMLAEDDPKLKALKAFEKNFPHVVGKLRIINNRKQLVKAKAIQDELPPTRATASLQTGTDTEESGTQAGGTGSSSTGTQSQASGVSSEMQTQADTIQSEEALQQAHDEEEKQVAENYAERLTKQKQLSPEEVERLLQDHALSMQALRKRQEEQKDQMKKKMQDRLKKKLKKDKYGHEPDEDDGSSNDRQKSSSSGPRPLPQIHTSMYCDMEDDSSSDESTHEVLKETMWNKMTLTHRMTAENMKDMVDSFKMEEEKTKRRSSKKKDDLAPVVETNVEEEEEFLQKWLAANKENLTEDDIKALLDEHLNNRKAINRLRQAEKERLNSRMKGKMGKKGKGSTADEEVDDGFVELDSQDDTESVGSAEGVSEALDDLTEDFLKALSQNRDLSEEDARKIIAEYRKRQAQLVTDKKAASSMQKEKMQDLLTKRLKDKKERQKHLDSLGADDDTFFERLQAKQANGELTKEEFSELLNDYLNKKKEEDRKKRRQSRKMGHDAEDDKKAASEMVHNYKRDKQELQHQRKAEKDKMDEKLRRRLQSKKKKQLMDTSASNLDTDMDSSYMDNSSFMNESSVLDE